MKTDQVILALQSIKRENIEKITNNKIEIEKLEKFLTDIESKISLHEKIMARLERIKSIKSSKSKTRKMVLKPIEAIIIAILVVLMVYLASSSLICICLAFLCCLVSFDIIRTYFIEIYPVSYDGGKGLIRNYLEFYKELMQNDNVINITLEEIKKELDCYNKEYNEKKRTKDLLSAELSKMQDENDYIEGNEIGLNILTSKYQIQEISDNLDVVEFVGKKLERRNVS